MTYQEAIHIFKENNENGHIEVETLGGRSRFLVEMHQDEKLKVINSNENTYIINENIWELVLKRMNALAPELKFNSKRYTLGNRLDYWQECPNKVLAVYIPAIIRKFIAYQTNQLPN